MSRFVSALPTLPPLGAEFALNPATGLYDVTGDVPQPLAGPLFASDLAILVRDTGPAGAPDLVPFSVTMGAVLTGGTVLFAAQPTATRIYQRDTRTGGAFGLGAGTVGVFVTLSSAATSLDYRLRDAATPATVLQDWTSLAGATAAGSASLTPAIPAGPHRYLMDVRGSGDAAHAVLGTQAFGVGEVVALSGQSLAANSIKMDGSDTTTLTALGLAAPVTSAEFASRDGDAVTPVWGPVADGQPYQAAYAAELLRVLSADAGVSCAMIGYAVSGTAISTWAPGQANNTQLKTVLTAAGGKFGAFVWVQGHNDASNGTSAATWTAAYNTIAADLASTYPAAPFVRVLTTIPSVLSTTYGSQGPQTIRSAAEGIAIASPATTAHVEGVDATLGSDGIHPMQAGYATLARHHARAIARLLGASNAGPAPVVTAASRAAGSNVLHLTLTNSGTALVAQTNAQFGTASTPTAAALARQFGVYASPLAYSSGAPQGAVGVSGAVIVDATHIDLTLATTPADSVALDVVTRMPPDPDATVIATGIYDNQVGADGLPIGRLLRVTGLPVTAAAPVPASPAQTSAFPVAFNGAAGAPTGTQVLTPAPGNDVSTAVLDGSGGLVLPSGAYQSGTLQAAGPVPAVATITATFEAGKQGIIAIGRFDAAGLNGGRIIFDPAPNGVLLVSRVNGSDSVTSTGAVNLAGHSTVGVRMASDGTWYPQVDGADLGTSFVPPAVATGYMVLGSGSGNTPGAQATISQVSVQ